ncbi:MAG: protein tyrosine phosphatase, partial [Polyangiaceae bacterium]|nr:protein tyrosine phosphatase [Polyangiaceae bacterium]
MPAYVDLHSHWVPGVDDGARSVEEGLELLAALAHAGFHKVVATPHMRPGVFDNRREDLLRAFQAVQPHV